MFRSTTGIRCSSSSISRLVRDKIILHAISEAYRSMLPSGTFPVTILFITIPFEDVDVNVHPAKTEVRFKHQASFTMRSAIRLFPD